MALLLHCRHCFPFYKSRDYSREKLNNREDNDVRNKKHCSETGEHVIGYYLEIYNSNDNCTKG